MDKEERSWTIWQPPVMLVKPARLLKHRSLQIPALQSFQLRNLFNVPAVTRATAHGTSLSKQFTVTACSETMVEVPNNTSHKMSMIHVIKNLSKKGVASSGPTLLWY